MVDHDHEIRDGWRVDGPSGTRTHDHADLRDDAACSNVPEEDFSVGAKTRDTFLDPSTATVVHADDRSTSLQSHVEHLADLQAMHLPEASSVDGEILCVCEDLSSIDGPMPGDHTVPWDDIGIHPEVPAPVLDQRIDFLETPLVKQQFEALPCSEFPACMLSIDPRLTATSLRLGFPAAQVIESIFRGAHPSPIPNHGVRHLCVPRGILMPRLEEAGCSPGHMDRPYRIVVAKPGLDGHDRGAKIVARALRDGGHEVIYTGLRRSPEQIVSTVEDEDARFLGLSSLSGAHGHLFPAICEALRQRGLDDVIVFGGGIIPQEDRPALHEVGVRAIFGPGSPTGSMLAFVEEAAQRRRDGAPVGVGDDPEWTWSPGE